MWLTCESTVKALFIFLHNDVAILVETEQEFEQVYAIQ